MQPHVATATLAGIEAKPVTVEAATSSGLPVIRIVGLPDATVREAADRIRSACHRSGLTLPQARIVVNLAPAGLPKRGGAFDLPVVLAILGTIGAVPAAALDGLWAAGEVGLDGTVRPTAGTLPIAAAAWRGAARRLLVAAEVAPEAALVSGLDVVPVRSLVHAVQLLRGADEPESVPAPERLVRRETGDLADVRGQPVAARALEIAAAGGHHLLLVGPPGCGKSMLARRLPGLLPALEPPAALESAAIRSVAGLRGGDEPLDLTPPFREPHHTTSLAGLIGGGPGIPRPGELSLAHHGVLFLDELLETPRWVLDALREPLETGRVVLTRASGTVVYPSRVQLIAATNPCPCGGSGALERACRCRPDVLARYRARLSGPLLDRIDVQVALPAVPTERLTGPPDGEPTALVAARVLDARKHADSRWGMPVMAASIDQVRATCAGGAVRRMASAVDALGLSARAFDRCLRVARTVADLAGETVVTGDHVDEAVALRLPPETLA